LPLFLPSACHVCDLHSFPTRRSSDLVAVLGWNVVDAFAVDENVAAGNLLETRHHAQGGRFAAARRAHEDDEFLVADFEVGVIDGDRKSTRLNSSHVSISYAVFCLKKK